MFFKAFLDDNAYKNICQKCRKIRYISNQVLPMAISLIYMYIYTFVSCVRHGERFSR